MRAGPLTLDGRVLLSPLCGVTDSPFRTIARRHGAAMVFCEMTAAEGLVRKNPRTLELLEYREEERPVGAQICGSGADVMADAARACEDLGFDSVDLNYGCPVRKVIAREAGAAMLTDLDRLGRVTSAVVDAVRVPVTAKIRIGWDQSSVNAHEVARVLEDSGVRWVTVHARCRSEKFAGQAHWDVIGRVKEACGIPVIGNGDVKTPEDADRMIRQTGCDAVMVGRGSFGNPWLFRRAERLLGGDDPGPAPTPAERIGTAIGHMRDMAARKGEYAAVLMRKHVAWYVRGLYDNSTLCREVNHAKSVAEVEDLLRAYLARIEAFVPPDGSPPARDGAASAAGDQTEWAYGAPAGTAGAGLHGPGASS
jgi:tRNA-dihydrouridine synthase B